MNARYGWFWTVISSLDRWPAVLSLSSKIGCALQTLNNGVNVAEGNNGKRAGVSSALDQRMKALERESREPRQANEILRKASAYFALVPVGECLQSPVGQRKFDRRSK